MRIIHILLAALVVTFAFNAEAVTQRKNKSVAAKQSQKAQKASPSKKSALIAKKSKQGKKIVRAAYEAPSLGRISGLHSAPDALDLKSGVALVIDQETNEVLFNKNESAILPIASITKLMTGIVISEANLPMNEIITIAQEDVQHAGFSRLKAGASMSRQDMLHLALMSSENRAAYALGRTFPGGMTTFVRLMNAKALMLGMTNTHYVEPTGLSSDNRSTAQDLAKLVTFASYNPVVSELSISHGYQHAAGKRTLNYVNTNRLTSNPNWDIAVQKTGYISAAGRCLVMQTTVAGRKLVMVFLDSMGKNSRLGDAERVRAWVESRPAKAPHA
jgi:D-alanyl-D-alanine endopeptidase (penicillin-binding protein 7)